MPAPAPRFSATPGEARPIGTVGGATAEVLAELGYDATELAELRDAGAVE